jgi:hypothetical protein
VKKKITLEVELPRGGKVVERRPGHFEGGVESPELNDEVAFVARAEELEDGVFNPVEGANTVEGAFQVTVNASAAGYREVARFFLALAELDTTADPSFHEHVDGVLSPDGRTRIDFIFRKRS